MSESYGTSRRIADASSQIATLIDSDGSSTHLADYSYRGLGNVVQQDSWRQKVSGTVSMDISLATT